VVCRDFNRSRRDVSTRHASQCSDQERRCQGGAAADASSPIWRNSGFFFVFFPFLSRWPHGRSATPDVVIVVVALAWIDAYPRFSCLHRTGPIAITSSPHLGQRPAMPHAGFLLQPGGSMQMMPMVAPQHPPSLMQQMQGRMFAGQPGPRHIPPQYIYQKTSMHALPIYSMPTIAPNVPFVPPPAALAPQHHMAVASPNQGPHRTLRCVALTIVQYSSATRARRSSTTGRRTSSTFRCMSRLACVTRSAIDVIAVAVRGARMSV
jgi:hypothetical protein